MLLSELDYVIGVHIMGYEPCLSDMDTYGKKRIKRTIWTNDKKERFHFSPSTSAEHSRRVAQRLIAQGHEFRLFADGEKWVCSFSKEETHFGVSLSDNEAICRAAIKALSLHS